jgi:nucleoside phosphorylase
MTGVVCALRWEANPIIRYFGLKKDKESNKPDIYYNDDMVLVISGVGMVRSSAATAFLYSKITNFRPIKEIQSFINIGTCGCLQKDIPLGKCFLANKISNIYSKKDFYPDILIKHNFAEANLITYSTPVFLPDNDISVEKALVDMEGAGFFESSSIFLPPHKIFCIKIVSDMANPQSVSSQFIEDIIDKNMKDIEEFIYNQKKALLSKTVFSDNEKLLIETVAQKIRMTKAQYHSFYQLCVYKKNRKQSLGCLNDYLSSNISDKAERSKFFEQIKESLSS